MQKEFDLLNALGFDINIDVPYSYFPLFQSKRYAFEGVSTTSRGCRNVSLCIGHKISSLHVDGAAASCPSWIFDDAKISILFYMFQTICQNIKIFYNYCSILPSLRSKRYRASSRAATPSILWVGTGPPFTIRRRSLLPISTAQLPNIHGHMGLAEN